MLLLCPFCGSNNIMLTTDRELAGNPSVWHNGPRKHIVLCQNISCGVSIEKRSRYEVINTWNRRDNKVN